jgi:FMN phosphatase YigB (HAD superfamily)
LALHPPPVITFDFHDTLAHCDRWFQLEIRELVPAFMRWSAARAGDAVPGPETEEAGRAAYRELRGRIRDTGVEQDAVSCLLEILPGLGIDADEAEVRAGVDELMRETLDDDVRPVPGSVETVRALAGAGVRLGVVSSAVYTPFLHWALDRFGIRDLFADILTSADAGFYKSDPEIYRISARNLGTTPDRITHVGDSYQWDIASPRDLGGRGVWLRHGRPNPDGPAPHLTIETLEGAAPALLALASSPRD